MSHKKKVLIVDDDHVILMIHKLKVMKTGVDSNPQEFLNGREALDYIIENNNSEYFYIVLLDINMPVMSGWDFLDSIQKLNLKCKIKVAIVTSSVDQADQEKAKMYEEVFSYITKPVNDAEMAFIKNL
tara:strand:+ start:53013 stop:53396 length:384 start_codon:yes stop_codon:yes gene_type:complete